MGPASQRSATSRRAARSDGLRNRRQVLDAASAAFASHGLGASVNDIARDASVGVGTLYRHFPTKEHLLAEVVKERLAGLLDVVRALPDGDDPAVALVRWIEAASDHVSYFTAVGAWIRQAIATDPAVGALHRQVLADGDALLRAAQGAGRASKDATIGDLLAAIVALSPRTPDDPERPRRLLALLIEGLIRTPR